MATDRPEQRLASAARIVRARLLPPPAEVLVERGEVLAPDAIVAQARREGDIHAVDVAGALRISPRDVRGHLVVVEGQWLAAGTILAEKHVLFGRPRVVWAPVGGTIDALRDGRLYMRGDPRLLIRRAHLPGTVVDIIRERGAAVECTGLMVTGVWGAGGEARGALLVEPSSAEGPLRPESVTRDMRGAILVGGTLEDEETLRRARAVGLAGLVVPSLLPDLVDAAASCGVPIMCAQGYGRLPLAAPIYEALAAHSGEIVCLSASNADERYGPELVVPLGQPGETTAPAPADGVTPLVGATVRLTRPPHAGALGRIIALPDSAPNAESDLPGPAVEVRLEDGRRVTVPIRNVDLLA